MEIVSQYKQENASRSSFAKLGNWIVQNPAFISSLAVSILFIVVGVVSGLASFGILALPAIAALAASSFFVPAVSVGLVTTIVASLLNRTAQQAINKKLGGELVLKLEDSSLSATATDAAPTPAPAPAQEGDAAVVAVATPALALVPEAVPAVVASDAVDAVTEEGAAAAQGVGHAIAAQGDDVLEVAAAAPAADPVVAVAHTPDEVAPLMVAAPEAAPVRTPAQHQVNDVAAPVPVPVPVPVPAPALTLSSHAIAEGGAAAADVEAPTPIQKAVPAIAAPISAVEAVTTGSDPVRSSRVARGSETSPPPPLPTSAIATSMGAAAALASGSPRAVAAPASFKPSSSAGAGGVSSVRVAAHSITCAHSRRPPTSSTAAARPPSPLAEADGSEVGVGVPLSPSALAAAYHASSANGSLKESALVPASLTGVEARRRRAEEQAVARAKASGGGHQAHLTGGRAASSVVAAAASLGLLKKAGSGGSDSAALLAEGDGSAYPTGSLLSLTLPTARRPSVEPGGGVAVRVAAAALTPSAEDFPYGEPVTYLTPAGGVLLYSA